MGEVSTIGLDLAKQAFHVHGADSAGRPLFSRNISRPKLEPSEDDFLDGLAVDALRACEASAWASGNFGSKADIAQIGISFLQSSSCASG